MTLRFLEVTLQNSTNHPWVVVNCFIYNLMHLLILLKRTFGKIARALMQKEGLQSIFPMEDISVMGIWELLPYISKIRVRII